MLLLLRQVLLDPAFMGCADHLRRLRAGLSSYFSVSRLHLFMRARGQLSVARLVSGDLRRACASYPLLFEVFVDLLAAGTGGLQILSRVPCDLRLAALPPFNVIALAF